MKFALAAAIAEISKRCGSDCLSTPIKTPCDQRDPAQHQGRAEHPPTVHGMQAAPNALHLAFAAAQDVTQPIRRHHAE
jgi:hypothetical protein